MRFKRISKEVKCRLKKYTVQIDEEKLGYSIGAIITLSCTGPYTPKEHVIAEKLSVTSMDE